jgi:hypothetical protein
MVKTGEAQFPADGRVQVRPILAADPRIPKLKKERPASKGRIHKGRTRS